MGYRSILVPLEESNSLDSVLTLTLMIARQFQSHIEGFCIRPSLAGAIAVGFEGGVAALAGTEEQFEIEQGTRSERLKEQFDKFIKENNLKNSQPNENNELTVSWNENEASGIGLFGQRGRVFDLIVVGRPTPGALTPAMNTLETVLFESGRPVLIAPPTISQKIIDHIAIAWNGSTETARTIAFAMPLIKNAKHISILNIEGAMVPGPTAVEVANSLTRQDITVDIINREGKRSPSDAGALMLNETENIGANLLIKGGYTQSRLRQMIFGGATNHILNEAKMPVLMAH
ncbi:MAG: universal stress protein UspA [Rhodospirillaceae bacterium]|nr:universal stress protein UspA [Rhodospirillaceae bacterium]|tara:strand:- start:391 stop:1257 length:867 start_codon:yes stop_codon:yes gene_type:complete